MLPISAAAALEKNSMADAGAWLILLEVLIGESTLRFAYNTENVEWNGETWYPFSFQLDEVTESSQGEFPSVAVKVSNVTRAVQYYVETANGAVGASVTLRIVHSEHLDLTTPEVEETFAVTKTVCDNMWVTFTLGAAYPVMARRPWNRYLKNFCPYKYKDIECGATSSDLTCTRTLADCQSKGNSVRFGGEPAIPLGGLYATL